LLGCNCVLQGRQGVAADAGKPRLGHEAVKEFAVRLRRKPDLNEGDGACWRGFSQFLGHLTDIPTVLDMSGLRGIPATKINPSKSQS
jgi:hypothetical protein